MEMNVRQLETMTLDRNGKEKKTSKIKKFFKKLSNKKDTSKGDAVDHLAPSRHDERLPSTDSEKSNNRLSSTFNGSSRRRSDGTISLYSVNDATNCYLTQATPSTKRRLFAINLSFMKKGRRQQQHRNNNNTKNNDITDKPSDTVRALCSPYASRRNRLTPTTPKPAPLINGGRRASESTVYRIQQQQQQHDTATTNNSPPFILTRNNTATTSTTLQQQRRIQQQQIFSSTATPQHINNKHNKLRQQHSTPTMTTTTHRTLLTTNFQFTHSPSVTFPPCTLSRQNSGSSDDEADYINYPFSKSNVVAPQKPTRTASKGSKGMVCSP